MTKKRNHKEFKEYLVDKLQNPRFALAYLNEALADEDQRVFLLALKNVLEAQGGNMTSLAQETKLSRQHLYRILSKKGNPRLMNIRSVLQVVGLDLAVQPFKGK